MFICIFCLEAITITAADVQEDLWCVVLWLFFGNDFSTSISDVECVSF